MEATLEPRLVMKGEEGKPFVSGEFFVAAYQRGYRWSRNEVRQLLDDIQTNAREAKARRALPDDYYLQPIVVLDRKDGTWELVDGQQRLTTLFLITKFISTKLPGAKVAYWLTYETRKESRAYLENLDPARRDENIDFHHIAQAYDAIVQWFGEQANASQAAIDIHTALSEWVYVIWYQAPDGTNPNALFTRLNRDRIPLTDSELIRALVLRNSGAANGQSSRQQEIAAQWDGFERDLRDEQFWAFLTRSTANHPTHIDFLFESMTSAAGLRVRPRFWTFEKVREDIERRGKEIRQRETPAGKAPKDIEQRASAEFWRDAVERHGLLIGWYRDRLLYHRIGYLVQIGDSIPDLIHASRLQTHSAFRDSLRDRIRQRLKLTKDAVSLLQYDNPKHTGTCTYVLLLMNVQTVLSSTDIGSRFSFHAYATEGWSLEHIHAQHSQALTKENERRDWLDAHVKKIRATSWSSDLQPEADSVVKKMDAHFALPVNKTDDIGFQDILDRVFALFGAPDSDLNGQDVHRLGNLVLLQRDFNSKLNNAVFAVKRERILELDGSGAYILPCTRNVFLKYYTASADQQLSIWSPQDQESYYDRLIEAIDDFLLPDTAVLAEVAA